MQPAQACLLAASGVHTGISQEAANAEMRCVGTRNTLGPTAKLRAKS